MRLAEHAGASTYVGKKTVDRKCLIRATGGCGRFSFAEFFAGIGLVRLALERHEFRTVFANDIDADKAKMYQDNFPSDEFRLGDIHLLDANDIPDCDVFAASFPCTDLSIAGAMRGIHSGESSAFWGLIRILREMKERFGCGDSACERAA